jgi:hypothetical protein
MSRKDAERQTTRTVAVATTNQKFDNGLSDVSIAGLTELVAPATAVAGSTTAVSLIKWRLRSTLRSGSALL